MKLYKTTVALFLAFITAWMLSYYHSPEQRAKRCIKASERTDSDICNCLYKNGLNDSIWCN